MFYNVELSHRITFCSLRNNWCTDVGQKQERKNELQSTVKAADNPCHCDLAPIIPKGFLAHIYVSLPLQPVSQLP